MQDIWMVRIKRALKIIAITLIVLIIAVTGFLIWALNNPRAAFALAERYLLPADLSIKWEEMHFAAKRHTWLNWDIDWKTKNLVIKKVSPEVHLPLADVVVIFNARAFADGPWLSFREVTVFGGEAASFKSSGRSSTGASQSPFEQLRDYLGYLKTGSRWLTMEKLDVRVPRFALIAADGKSESVFAARMTKPMNEGKDQSVGLEADAAFGDVKLKVAGWIDANRLDTDAHFTELKIGAGGAKWQTESELRGSFKGDHATFGGGAKVEVGEARKAIRGQPKFTLAMSSGEALLKVRSAIANVPGPWVRLDPVDLEMRVPFDNGITLSERPATFKLSTPIDLFFIDKNMRPPLEEACRCKIPEKLNVHYGGRIWFAALLDNPVDPLTVLDSNLLAEDVDNRLLTLKLSAHLRVQKHKELFLLEPRLDSVATVQSFQGLRRFLDARNVMIPAPVDVLDGKITMSARGNVDHDDKLIRTAIEIKTDLASATQKVLVETTIRLDLARDLGALDLYVQSNIQDIRLELPPIDPIRGIPSVKTDSRLLFKPEKASKSKFKLRVFFDVRTNAPGALKLTTRFANPHIPITINVNNANKGESAGSVRLEPFTISYLRRKVNVERLQVTLSENEDGDFPIGGRLRIDQTAYKIFVDLAGTLDAPVVNLNSDPFLPRSDIISVLLFDRVNDQLVSADADTAGGVEAALADRAIGLIGLWAFATTPIRSFSYNPVTKVYTATVQLADGLTAGVGTNWERAAHLEVRKRVSRRWVLTASWSPNNEREQVGKLVLQWEKRF